MSKNKPPPLSTNSEVMLFADDTAIYLTESKMHDRVIIGCNTYVENITTKANRTLGFVKRNIQA